MNSDKPQGRRGYIGKGSDRKFKAPLRGNMEQDAYIATNSSDMRDAFNTKMKAISDQ